MNFIRLEHYIERYDVESLVHIVFNSQIEKTIRWTSNKHRSDADVSDWCLMDADPKIFAILEING